MHWAVSDVHGCYEQYRKLLEKIHFSPSDTLYFLGDAVDRGPEPMKVVLDLASRDNVVPLLGNHDWLAWQVLRRFGETNRPRRLAKRYSGRGCPVLLLAEAGRADHFRQLPPGYPCPAANYAGILCPV